MFSIAFLHRYFRHKLVRDNTENLLKHGGILFTKTLTYARNNDADIVDIQIVIVVETLCDAQMILAPVRLGTLLNNITLFDEVLHLIGGICL